MNREISNITATVSPGASSDAQFWQFKNSADNSNEATLYIYGDIVAYDLGYWNWPDDVVPNKFKNELNALGDVETIHVRINSGGGSVFASYAIMNLLKSHKARIITYNDGIAASAATIIAMAGDKIVTALGSVWMIHLPAQTLYGTHNANELAKITEALNTMTQSMVDIYSARTGIDRAELETMMSEETWFTGTEACEKGFADEITEIQAVAYLSSDKETAFFNGLSVDVAKIRSKDKFVNMLPVRTASSNSEHAASGSTKQPVTEGQPPTKNASPYALSANESKEESIVDLNELKQKYPNIYNEAVKEGMAQGVQNERARIKEIEDMALPGMESFTNRAKFETGTTASELAVDIIKAQKQKGAQYIEDIRNDAAPLNNIPASGAPQDDSQEEMSLLASLKARAENIKR